MRRLIVKWLVAHGWTRVEWVKRGTVSTWRHRHDIQVRRARAAEDILRHAERLLRNDPNYQRIRAQMGAHLTKYRDYTQRSPDEIEGAA